MFSAKRPGRRLSWQQRILLVRRTISNHLDEFRPDGAIVQKGISFGRGAIGADGFPFVARRDQKGERPAFYLNDLFRKPGIPGEVEQVCGALDRDDFIDARILLIRSAFMAGEYAQRSAMSLQFFNVENTQSFAFHNPVDDPERKIGKMLVIDRVELFFFNHAKKVRKLECRDPLGLEDNTNPPMNQ